MIVLTCHLLFLHLLLPVLSLVQYYRAVDESLCEVSLQAIEQ